MDRERLTGAYLSMNIERLTPHSSSSSIHFQQGQPEAQYLSRRLTICNRATTRPRKHVHAINQSSPSDQKQRYAINRPRHTNLHRHPAHAYPVSVYAARLRLSLWITARKTSFPLPRMRMRMLLLLTSRRSMVPNDPEPKCGDARVAYQRSYTVVMGKWRVLYLIPGHTYTCTHVAMYLVQYFATRL